jgi:hypothetical protein
MFSSVSHIYKGRYVTFITGRKSYLSVFGEAITIIDIDYIGKMNGWSKALLNEWFEVTERIILVVISSLTCWLGLEPKSFCWISHKHDHTKSHYKLG